MVVPYHTKPVASSSVFQLTLALVVAFAAFDVGVWLAWVLVVSPVIVFGGVGLGLAGARRSIHAPPASLVLAFAVRYLDTVVWIVRYAVAFSLIGHPISPIQATVFAAAAQLAMLVPFVGNGLGVREWGIGLTLPLLEREAASAIGLTADLLNRAVEVMSAVPIGLICLGVLARQRHQRRVNAQE